MKTNNILLLAALPILSLLACTSNKQSSTPEETETDTLLTITQEQFSNNKMSIGAVSKEIFQESVACKGYVFAPSNSMSKVSPIMAGNIDKIHLKLGDFVKAGQVIAELSSSEFMNLQQDFADAAALFFKSKSDYLRAKTLWDERIGAEKDFIAAQSLWRSSQTRYETMRSRLKALSLNPSSIEKGKLYTSFPLIAPISGYITAINAVIGQHIDVNSSLVEIINTKGLQLRLSVFANDVQKLKVNQTVDYTIDAQNGTNFKATLQTIGKIINSATKTVDCVATLPSANAASLIHDSFVEAKIIVGERQVNALPVSAVQKQGNDYFIFVVESNSKEQYKVKKTPVAVGDTFENFIEITTNLDNKKILTQGIETLN